MPLTSIKAVVATVWVLVVCLAGIAWNLTTLTSVPSWLVLAGVALLPPIVMVWQWNDPPQSMSEIIQEARR